MSALCFANSFSEGPKVIYVPPPPPEEEDTIFAHYETGINFNKYDDILVDVSGNAPLAIMVSHCLFSSKKGTSTQRNTTFEMTLPKYLFYWHSS